MNKYLNRVEEKWAHPEILADNAYVAGNDNYGATQSYVGKTIEEIEAIRTQNYREDFYKAMQPTFPKFWNENYNEQYYTITEGCPEEMDAPPVRIMVRTPKDIKEKEKLPVIFSIPAGGMTDCGTVETNVFTVLNSIKEDSRYIIVLTEYRIAPAYQYPAALNDLHASYNWILSNAEKLHINKNKIVITGGSAGGYLALCLGFRLKRYNWCEGPMPRGLVVVTPMMDDASQNQSYKITFENEVGEELNWTGKVNREAMKLYLGDRFGDQFLTPEAVPSHASLEDVKGMPPMWFPAQAENDPGRDSVYKLVSLLHEANIFCDLHMWGGAAHTTTTCVSTDFAQRMRSVERGAIRDAITFDFRRAWLTEE